MEEGDSPAAGSGHRLHVTWDEPRGARVSNAENTLFTRWHSQRQTRPDEPGVPRFLPSCLDCLEPIGLHRRILRVACLSH